MKKISLFVAFCLLSFSAFSNSNVYTVKDNVALKSFRSNDAKTLGLLKKDSKLQLVNLHYSGWAQVIFNSIDGWILSANITRTVPRKVTKASNAQLQVIKNKSLQQNASKTVNSRVRVLLLENNSLSKKNSALTSKAKKILKKQTKLLEKNKDLNKDNGDLSQKNKALSAKIETTFKQNKNLNKKNRDLLKKNKKLNNTLKELTSVQEPSGINWMLAMIIGLIVGSVVGGLITRSALKKKASA